MPTPTDRQAFDVHDYPVSLQQAAAAVFGVTLVDGAPRQRPLRPGEVRKASPQQQG